MNSKNSLFYESNNYIAPIDHEKDPKIMSGWTHDAVYLRGLVGK